MKKLLLLLVASTASLFADYTQIKSSIGELPAMNSSFLAERYYTHHEKSNGFDNYRLSIGGGLSYRKQDFFAKATGIIGSKYISRVRKVSQQGETIKVSFYNSKTRKAGTGYVHASIVSQKFVEENTKQNLSTTKAEPKVRLQLKKSTFEILKADYDIKTKGDLRFFLEETLPGFKSEIAKIKAMSSNPEDKAEIKSLSSKRDELETEVEELSSALADKTEKLEEANKEIKDSAEIHKSEKTKSMVISFIIALLIGLGVGFFVLKKPQQ